MGIVSLNERIQMLVMVFHVYSIPLLISYFLFCCAFPPFWAFDVIYIIYLLSDSSYEDGSKLTTASMFFRDTVFWKYFASYFPITLHKTVDLEPSFTYDHSTLDESEDASEDAYYNSPTQKAPFFWRITFWWYYYLLDDWLRFLHKNKQINRKVTGKRYLFGYHPHGIIGMGMVGGVVSNGASWLSKFPGIPVRGLTLNNNFMLPFYKNYLSLLGMASVSRESCRKLLEKYEPICIVIGGAQESLLAHPGTMDLVLRKRYGFIKLAMDVGNVDLVPILAFGENEVYDQVRNDNNSLLYKIQTLIKRIFGFTLPLMHARGVFSHNVGIIPYRNPINIVVGAPINVPHIAKPTKEQIDFYHDQYMDQLKELFETHKKEFYLSYYQRESYELHIVE